MNQSSYYAKKAEDFIALAEEAIRDSSLSPNGKEHRSLHYREIADTYARLAQAAAARETAR